MHEWALAEAVIEATSSALGGRDPACLKGVTVLLGELQAIDREIFSFALDTLVQERAFRGTAWTLQTEPASFRCTSCEKEWRLSDAPGVGDETQEAIHFLPEAVHAFVRCPSCGSPDYRVQAGRGVRIQSLTLDSAGSCA